MSDSIRGDAPERASPATARLDAATLGASGFVLWLMYNLLWFGLNPPPATSGDEASYDSLGWELHRGRGFQLNYDDPEFRAPYDAAAADSELYRLPRDVQGPITSRPPLWPLCLAAGDLLCGRQFWAARLFNFALLTGTLMTIVYLTRRRAGLIVTLVVALGFIVLDVRVRLYGRAILTEPLALALTTALWLLLSRSPVSACRGGLLYGACILARTQSVLWAPVLFPLVWRLAGAAVEPPQIGAATLFARRLGAIGVFLLFTVLCVAPWGFRNMLALGRPMPLGTQGLAQLAAGYSDEAWRREGVWFNLEDHGVFNDLPHPGLSLIDQELLQAERSRALAGDWARRHPLRAASLFFFKIFHELRPRDVWQGVLLMGAVWGALISWSERSTRVGVGLWAANLLSIGLTWSVEEARFVVPLLGVQYVLAGRGFDGLVRQAVGMLRSFRNTGDVS